MSLTLVFNILLAVFALIVTILAFFAFQQLRLLNKFLKTPLARILNLLALLFFAASLASMILAGLLIVS